MNSAYDVIVVGSGINSLGQIEVPADGQQFFLWRPLRALKNHETSVKNLYHVGASTHPGPGLAGNSGYMVARGLTS